MGDRSDDHHLLRWRATVIIATAVVTAVLVAPAWVALAIRRRMHKRYVPPKPDYARIHRLERELFGERMTGNPRRPGKEFSSAGSRTT